MTQTVDLATQLEYVENHIENIFKNHPLPLVRDITKHSLFRQGKRVRAKMVILSAEMLGYCGQAHYQLATIIELLHGATLLHDDVIDQSDIRRHHKTAHTLWGNKASILLGDLTYAEAFKLISQINRSQIIAILAQATSEICSGEIYQLSQRGNLQTTMDEYLKIIEAKTATLFAAACRSAASLCNQPDNTCLEKFGQHFGMAYQLTDDLLDLRPNNPDFDKNIGDDIRDGKITGPIIELLSQINQEQRQQLHHDLQNPSKEAITRIQMHVANNQSKRTQGLIKEHIQLALDSIKNFPSSSAKQLLTEQSISLSERLK